MNNIARVTPFHHSTDQQNLLSLWVNAGVHHFGKTRLEFPSTIFSQSDAAQQLACQWKLSQSAWTEIAAHSNPQSLQLSHTVDRLMRDYQLNIADIFLLSLCGEVENSYQMNLALAELQSPDSYPRPRMHLISELLHELFGINQSPVDFTDHPLVHAGIISLVGNEPWPLRHMQVDTRMWLLLRRGAVKWPDAMALPPANPAFIPESMQQQLPLLAQQIRLGQLTAVVLRGARKTAFHIAAELASYLNLTAVKIQKNAWQEEKPLQLAALYDNWLSVVELELGPGDVYNTLETVRVPQVIVCGHEGTVHGRSIAELDVPGFTQQQRRHLWQQYLSSPTLAEELADSALLDGAAIQQLSQTAQTQAARQQEMVTRQHITNARRRAGSNRLRQLAQPVTRQIHKEALILPAGVDQQVQQLIQRCRKREGLWQALGCTAQASLNMGVRVLFSGESGTGKTLAASYLATELGAPLYRLDLASVMNKYIGETEKNLGLLLDEAAATDTILLMDEADALFGKRTEATGAGDRFANMLTNYLLTRIETHPGIAILTSNGRSRIDAAFTRRLDAIIEFTAPAAAERYLIWQSHLGVRSPGEQFCYMLASYSELPGGFIRNAVLNAAMQIDMAHSETIPPVTLLRSLMEEYRKLGKAIPTRLEQLAQSPITN